MTKGRGLAENGAGPHVIGGAKHGGGGVDGEEAWFSREGVGPCSKGACLNRERERPYPYKGERGVVQP